jgi:hypothetical protein
LQCQRLGREEGILHEMLPSVVKLGNAHASP